MNRKPKAELEETAATPQNFPAVEFSSEDNIFCQKYILPHKYFPLRVFGSQVGGVKVFNQLQKKIHFNLSRTEHQNSSLCKVLCPPAASTFNICIKRPQNASPGHLWGGWEGILQLFFQPERRENRKEPPGFPWELKFQLAQL